MADTALVSGQDVTPERRNLTGVSSKSGDFSGHAKIFARFKRTRIAEIDIVRGICVTAMLAFHVLILGFDGSAPLHYVAMLMNSLTVIRMPVLMFVSGLLVSKMLTSSRIETLKRFAKLVWLFVIWTPLIYISMSSIAGKEVVAQDIILQIANSTTPLWFIASLAMCTLSLIWLRPHQRNIVITISVVTGGIFWAEDKYNLNNMMYGNTVRIAAMFYCGVYLAPLIIKKLRAPFDGKSALFAFAIITTIPAVDWVIRSAGLSILGSLERLFLGYIALIVATIFRFMPNISQFLQWLGRNTLPIYLGHIPILAVVLQLKDLLPFSDLLRYPLIVTMTTAGTLLAKEGLSRCGAGWLYEMPAGLISGRSASGSITKWVS